MNNYKNVVLGASFFGCGLYSHLDGESLIIEKNIFLGSEFCHSFNLKRCNLERTYGELTNKLISEMKNRKAINELGVYTALAPSFCLAKIMNDMNADILFDTVVTDIKKSDGGFLITIFNTDGICEIFTEKIYDTTDNNELEKQRLYGCAVSSLKDVDDMLCGAFINEYFLLNKAENDDFILQRKVLYEVAKEKSVQILNFSPVFAYEYKNKEIFVNNDGYYVCPSSSYGDLLSAFECGGAR